MNEEPGNQISGTGSDRPSSSAPATQGSGDAGRGTGIARLISGIASMLGLGHGKPDDHGIATGDVSTRLAHERTDLALDRNYLAAERTLMAWIRTLLSMISFGFTIGKLGQVLHEVEVKGVLGHVRTMSTERIADFLVVLGTAALIGAALQYWQRMRQLRAMGLGRQLPITLIVALLLAALGGFALSALVLAL